MGIDTGIYANLLRPPKSVAEYDQEAQASQLNALQLQNGRMKQDEYQRGIADQNALRDATRGFGADTTANYNALLRTGNMKAAQEYQKGIGDQDLVRTKTAQEATQTKGMALDQSIKAHEFQVQKLAAVSDPQGALAWAQEALQNGVFSPEQYQRGVQALQQASQSPQAFAEWRQKALQGGQSATQTLVQEAEALKQAEQKRQFGVTSAETGRHHVATEGLTARGQNMTQSTAMRGQNMVDARSKESTAATMTKPFEVTGPDGTPVLVQQDKQGNIKPVQGFGPKAGAGKPLNDSQSKALLFGSRMQESDKILNNLSAKGVDRPSLTKSVLEEVPFIGGALGAAANVTAASPDQQSVEQAQRDFVNAVLRRESGAAIATSEFNNAAKQYFPSLGDSAQVKAQKAANRKLAIQGLLAEVPAGQRQSISSPAESGSAAPAGKLSAAEQAELDQLRKQLGR